MFKMSDLISWELTETLRREFDELEKYASDKLYAFQHGDNVDIKLTRVGFISSDPGIIFDIQNVFSFTQKEIEAWVQLFKDYGATDVDVGIDSTERTITIFVHFTTKREGKNSNSGIVYKLFSVYNYIPTFIWVYFSLVVWNPARYRIF